MLLPLVMIRIKFILKILLLLKELFYNEFKERWHDVDVNGKKFINHGIAIYGKENTFNLEKIIHLD